MQTESERADYWNKEYVKAIDQRNELLEALKGVTHILEAVKFTMQLGKSQLQRLDAAKTAIAKSEKGGA